MDKVKVVVRRGESRGERRPGRRGFYKGSGSAQTLNAFGSHLEDSASASSR